MKTETLKVERFYYDNGQLESELYLFKCRYYNPHGPAYRSWHKNGQLRSEVYWINNRCHNMDGPAVRRWDSNGQLQCEEYWIDNKQLTKEEFENRTKTCNGKIIEIDGKKYKLQEV